MWQIEQFASEEPAWLCHTVPRVIATTNAARTTTGISRQRIGFSLGTLLRLVAAPDQHHIRDGAERQRVAPNRTPRWYRLGGAAALAVVV
jgi:hypothetical protein